MRTTVLKVLAFLVAVAVGIYVGNGIAGALDAHEPLERDVIERLTASSVPIATDAPGSGLGDLAPLRAMIGDARIVAVGEATHGTREFTRMRHRVVELLAAEGRPVVVTLETGMADAEQLNAFVAGGGGSAEEAVMRLNVRLWQTEELRDLVAWARSLNASGRGRVELRGIDINEPDLPLSEALGYLRRHDPEFGDSTLAIGLALTHLSSLAGDVDAERRADYRRQWRAAASRLVDRFDRQRPRLTKRSGDSLFAWNRQCARLVQQSVELALIQSVWDWASLRDRYMAENLEWLLTQRPSARFVVSAHNGHVERAAFGVERLGEHLDRRHGDDLVVIGLATGAGSYAALDSTMIQVRPYRLRGPIDGTIEQALRSTGRRIALVDLRRLTQSDPDLDRIWGLRHIGAARDSIQFYPSKTLRTFDILVYIDSTTASRPLAPSIAER